MHALRRSMGFFLMEFFLGFNMALVGPTLAALARQTETTLGMIGMIFFLLSGGLLAGTILGSNLFDWAPNRIVLGVAQILSSALVFLIPSVPFFWALMALFVVEGICLGVVNTGANTLLLWMHGKKSGPFVNALHFFFGLGALLSPFFLGLMLSAGGVYGDAYHLVSVLGVCFGLAVLLRLPAPAPLRMTAESEKENAFARIAPLLLISILMLFFYVGGEITFTGWIATYAAALSLANAAQAAYLTSLFYLAFTASRLLAVPLAMRFSPPRMIVLFAAGGVFSLMVLLLLPENPVALWLATAGVGFFFGPLWPNAFNLAGQSLHMSARISGIILLGNSLGGMVVPFLAGLILEQTGPAAMMKLVLGCLTGMIIMFAVMTAYTGRHKTALDELAS